MINKNTNHNIIEQINRYEVKWSKNPNKERVLYYSFDKTEPTHLLDYIKKFDRKYPEDMDQSDRENFSNILLINASEPLKIIARKVLADLEKHIGVEFTETDDPEKSNIHFLTFKNEGAQRYKIDNVGLTMQIRKKNMAHSIVVIEQSEEHEQGLVAHEIGHALGLSHLEHDGRRQYTVMSNYDRTLGITDSNYFSMNDIKALQLSYGPDTYHSETVPQIQEPNGNDNNKESMVTKDPISVIHQPLPVDIPTVTTTPILPTTTEDLSHADMEYLYHRVTGKKDHILSLWQKLHQTNYQFDDTILTAEEMSLIQLAQDMKNDPQEKNWNHWSAPGVEWIDKPKVVRQNITSHRFMRYQSPQKAPQNSIAIVEGTENSDYLVANGGDKHLKGFAGNDYLKAHNNTGKHILEGGSGDDVYMFKSLVNQQHVIDSTGNNQNDWDTIKLDGDHERSLWLKKESQDLIIYNNDYRSKITITDYYVEGKNTIKQIDLNGKMIVDSNITKLAEAMATYDSSNKGVTASAQLNKIFNQCWVSLPTIPSQQIF
jgi:hypothetical protein